MDLKELLGEELFGQVQEKLGKKHGLTLHGKDEKMIVDDGKLIPKARFDEIQSANKALKGQLEDINTQLKTFESKVKDNDELSKKVKDLSEANERIQKESDEQLKKQRKDSAIENALIKSGAKSSKAVRALLDEEKISLDGDNLIGFKDQIEALKKSDSWAFGEKKLGGDDLNDGDDPPKDKDKPVDSKTFYETEVFGQK